MSHIEPHPYTEDQYRQIGMLESWYILLDAHNAVRYGFIQNRLPEPGKAIEVSEAESHISHIQREWEAERRIRDSAHQWTGAPAFTTMPLNAKLYLHSVLLDSRPPRLENPPQDVPTAPKQPQPQKSFLLKIMQWLVRR